MDDYEIDQLVTSWNRFMAVGIKSEEGPQHVWAVKVLNELLPADVSDSSDEVNRCNCELAWRIVLKMLETARSRTALRLVAPTLANLIRVHRHEVMKRLDEQAGHNPRLSYAVSFVYTADAALREQLRTVGCPWINLNFDDEAAASRQRDIKRLTRAWLNHSATASAGATTVAEELDDLAYGDPTLGWETILQISSECSKKSELCRLANQLATLLSSASGQHFFDMVVHEIACNRKLAYTVTELKNTVHARAGWLPVWHDAIGLAQQQR